MKTKYIILFISSILIISACEKANVLEDTYSKCRFQHADSSQSHPNSSIYQQILNENQKDGLVGAVLLVKDNDGLWIGASGMADIPSKVAMKPCNTFLIASISKVFTAAAIYQYVDQGIISLEDPVKMWLSDEVSKNVDNIDDAKIKHLLSHTSGIRDYYTNMFELDRSNRIHNNFTKEDVLKYIYGKKADFKVGETYGYCNTNYLLLALILEKVSNKSFEAVYQQQVFNPLTLTSAYYSEDQPIPEGCVRGYQDINLNGKLVDSQNWYQDEIGIGGDGGIAINAYDLAHFLEELMKGNLISETSIAQMTNWFEMPEDWHWSDYGQTENGYGLEKFDTKYGYAVGHTGGIDGYSSFAFYFPEQDMSYVLLINGAMASTSPEEKIFARVLDEMFK